MSDDLYDRRKESRKKVMAFTPVYTQLPKKLIGYLYDLTMQGALVVCTHAYQVNHKETLLIEFPDELTNLLLSQMTLEARVARCTPDQEAPDSFLVGFEFIDLAPENEKAIRALLERYHFRNRADNEE